MLIYLPCSKWLLFIVGLEQQVVVEQSHFLKEIKCKNQRRENQRVNFEICNLPAFFVKNLRKFSKLVKSSRLINFLPRDWKLMEMSSKESTTTNSSDGAGTHHSQRADSVPRSDHRSLLMKRKSSIPISASSVRSRSSCGDSIGGSSRTSKPPVTVTYKSVTTSGKMFSKKTTSVDCGVFVKDPGLV